MKTIFAVLILSALFFHSCKSNKQHKVSGVQNIVADTQQKITGEWQWIKTSCCGRTPKESTPKSTDTKVSLVFGTDNTFKKYTNATLEANGSFEINQDIAGDERSMLKLETVPRSAFVYFSNDTLVIDYGYIDLQTEWYIRKK